MDETMGVESLDHNGRVVFTSRTAFGVHSFDSDAFGTLSPVALAGYLQEAASQSADALGFGMSDLSRQGLTWVLVRERFELDEPIRFGDTVEVETWPSGIDRWAALRDFRVFKNGGEIGRALTSWFVLDRVTRRPVRPTTVLKEAHRFDETHVLPPASAPPAQLDAPKVRRHFQVRYGDIDANLHVTNASYVAWVVEAVDEPGWRGQWLSGLDIQFLSECSLGATVLSLSAPAGAGTLLHSVVRDDDSKELARAHSVWRPR
jgi:medium-chain acyl-[acyl-carrier-protein] hydrolase